jgi:hypothetical protein
MGIQVSLPTFTLCLCQPSTPIHNSHNLLLLMGCLHISLIPMLIGELVSGRVSPRHEVGGGTFPVSVTTVAGTHHSPVNIPATMYESEQEIKVYLVGINILSCNLNTFTNELFPPPLHIIHTLLLNLRTPLAESVCATESRAA